MEVIVNSKSHLNVKMDSVRISCMCKEGTDLDKRSEGVVNVNQRMEEFLRVLDGLKLQRAEVTMGGVSVQPRYALLERSDGNAKRTERTQNGWVVTGTISVLVPVGDDKLDDIGYAAERCNMSYSVHYELGESTAYASKTSLRRKLLSEAILQAKDILWYQGGEGLRDEELEVVKVLYGEVAGLRSAFPQERCASFGAMPGSEEIETCPHHLNLLYTKENAPVVTLNDEITVHFDHKRGI